MTESDQQLIETLRHASKTKAFLRRLKAERPEELRRVYGNVFRAMLELDADFFQTVTKANSR